MGGLRRSPEHPNRIWRRKLTCDVPQHPRLWYHIHMNEICPFCNTENSISKKIHSYEFWDLFLHAEEKRQITRQAAGFLALKRHEPSVINIEEGEWGEVRQIIADAAMRLCVEVGTTYSNQEITGFNRGVDAGQTVEHAHIHIFPIAEEDPIELKGRVGMSAAFEALYRERIK